MARAKPLVKMSVEIFDSGKNHELDLELFKTRLTIKDQEGNSISIDKRKNKMYYTARGNVKPFPTKKKK